MKSVGDSLSFSISHASIEDLDDLETLENHVFSSPWSRKSFEAELNGNQFSLMLVARFQDVSSPLHDTPRLLKQRMIGYICAWTVFEELRFMNIAVETGRRRQGIGSALLKKAIEIGRNRGAQRALLEVRQSNDSAQALYARFGFESYGTRLNYYTNPNENAMLMARDLLSCPHS